MELQGSLVSGDRVHITNVVYNLLDNAIKYSSVPLVEMRIEHDGNWASLSIKDNGIGLSPSDKDRVFEKFYRVSQGDRHDVKGFGLGLYYVKRIVQAHGGHVRVESEPGKGSTFTVTLPLVE